MIYLFDKKKLCILQISIAYLATIVIGQDYQDYPSAGRPSQLRLNSAVDTKPTPVPILKQINR